MASLANVPGLKRTSPWFRWALVQIGKALTVNPDFLATVISAESGFDPHAVNLQCLKQGKPPSACATGLIQFMPRTAERLGTSTDELRGMSAENQLFYVEKFYRPFAGKLLTVGDAFMATFMPEHAGQPDDFVLFAEGSKGYEQNAGLDRNKSGTITVGDVTAGAVARLASASGRVDVPEQEPRRPMAAKTSKGLLWKLGLATIVLGGAAWYFRRELGAVGGGGDTSEPPPSLPSASA